jgi:transposase
MKLHQNATLTPAQRREVRRRYQEEGISKSELARQFHTSHTTIARWVGRDDPNDRSSAPHHPARVITPEYRQAVLEERAAQPSHGSRRLAQDLKGRFGQAKPGTIDRILKQAGLAHTPVSAKPKPPRHIPVGRHRAQMDIQQLPAVEGGKGFEYKISVIHLRTRMKYSEIHPDHDSATVAAVLERALGALPPFGWS